MNIQQKTFIITGAGGGIGAALVHEILQRGGSVAAVDLNKDSLSLLKQNLDDAMAERLSLHELNITDRSSISKLPAQVQKIHGSIDALINNAGIIQPFVRIAELDYPTIERVMDVNFYGPLYLIKEFLPYLLERPEGYVVNVSSMGGFLPVPGQSIYGASKAALKLMSEGLFAELQDTNVHVSTVFPGATNTNITKNSNVSIPDIEQASSGANMMISAPEAARIIVNGIERNKPLIYTGKDSNLMQRLYRLAPVKATKLISSKMKALLN